MLLQQTPPGCDASGAYNLRLLRFIFRSYYDIVTKSVFEHNKVK